SRASHEVVEDPVRLTTSDCCSAGVTAARVGGLKMHIGLIGGIGPAATDFYYRRLISTFASKKVPLELTIVHADTPTLLSNLTTNDAAAQVAIFTRLTNRLVAAGAECVVVT